MPKELNLAIRTQENASVKMAIVVNFAKTLETNVKVSCLNIMVNKLFSKQNQSQTDEFCFPNELKFTHLKNILF